VDESDGGATQRFDKNNRQPWSEGPDEEAPPESWLGLGDDELLHQIQTLVPDDDTDGRLMEIVQSNRHFFIRQEAAKQIRDRSLLFPFENDRHVGQILVRILTRREDVTYLERLVARSHHVEVRAAAQVQLAQLWAKLGGPVGVTPAGADAPPPPEFQPPVAREAEIEVVEVAAEADEVNGSLLGWAVHFLVETTWVHLGTRTVTDLLTRTHAGLIAERPGLSFFRVEKDGHVTVDLSLGPDLPRETVRSVASWMMAFIDAAQRVAPDMEEVDVRQSTRLMGDALEQAGFYQACRELARAGRP
jgi:hypothetical protein